jgi:hypothetical protein
MSEFWKTIFFIACIILVIGLVLLLVNNAGRRREEHDEAMAALGRAQRYPVLFSDEFNSNEHDWLVGDFSSDTSIETRSIQDGTYRWESEAIQPFVGLVWVQGEPVSDFYIKIEARLDRSVGTWTAYFGPAFRVADSDGMRFYAFGHSEYVQRRGGGDDEYFNYAYYRFIRLLDDEPSELLSDFAGRSGTFPGLPEIRHPPDGTVEIVVVAEGSQFWCFIDGNYVDHVIDDELVEGLIGLAVMVPNYGEQTIIEFDSIELRAP